MPTVYIGKCASWSTVKSFLGMEKDAWLRKMKRSNAKVSPYPLDDAQIQAWSDCYDTLHGTLSDLPDAMKRLHIAFEYVLPQHLPGKTYSREDLGIRADVLLFSKKTVCVLELKQRSDLFIGHVRQARKYRRRLQKCHCASQGMNKKAVLLLTKAKNLREQSYKVTACSPDLLCAVLEELFEKAPVAKSGNEAEAWLNSDFRQ